MIRARKESHWEDLGREAMSSSFSRSESDKRMEEVGLGVPLFY